MCEEISPEEFYQVNEEEQQEEEDIFGFSETKEENKYFEIRFHHFKPQEFAQTDIKGNRNLIKLGQKDLVRLISYVEPTYDNFVNVLIFLFKSFYKKEFIEQLVSEWYLQDSTNDIDEISILFEYEYTETNCLFFKIVNKFNYFSRNFLLERYVNNTYDDSVKIDVNEPLTLVKMKNIDYSQTNNLGIRIGDFITDLKKVCAYVDCEDPVFLLKTCISIRNKNKISFVKASTFKSKLSMFKVGTVIDGKRKRTVNAWQIFYENVNAFTIENMCFYSEDKNVFNIFQGYEYDSVDDIDMNLIEPFFSHIFFIIANKNEDVYNYIVNWLCFIFQNINKKVRTALVITGSQRTGKSTFTNVICSLLGEYANDNANLENIIGKFNSSILYKKIIVCNEVKSYLSSKSFDEDILKTLITESTFDVRKKFHDVKHMENVANFIFLSNNFAPVKIDEDDGRYCVIEVSNDKRGDTKYFEKLYSSFSLEFYNNLLTYFLKLDISNFDPSRIPMTDAKRAIIDFCKSTIQRYIQDRYKKYLVGFPKKEAFQDYKSWCISQDIIKPGSHQEFKLEIRKYCSEENSKDKPLVYKLKQDCLVYFKEK